MVYDLDPLTGDPIPKPTVSAADTLQAHQLAELEQMTRDELLALVRRCNAREIGIGMMTKAEIAEAMMHQLAVRALDPRGKETLAAIQQWLDREKGKAVTPIAAQVLVKEEKVIDKRELARRIDFMLALAKEEDK